MYFQDPRLARQHTTTQRLVPCSLSLTTRGLYVCDIHKHVKDADEYHGPQRRLGEILLGLRHLAHDL